MQIRACGRWARRVTHQIPARPSLLGSVSRRRQCCSELAKPLSTEQGNPAWRATPHRPHCFHTPREDTEVFPIIAHIDHGKSTLADKLLRSTQNIWPTSKGRQQVLDSLEVERSRGITVKAQSASMIYVDPR